MEAEFYLSEKHDRHELETVNAKMKVKKFDDGRAQISFQACGEYVTFELEADSFNGSIKFKPLEIARGFEVEALKL